MRNLVTSKMSFSWSEVGCCFKGGFSHSFIAYRHHAETEGQFRTAPCCHFTVRVGCNITVCNLLLSVPMVLRNPYRRQGRRYKLPGPGNPEGGWNSGHVACVVILAVPPMLWEPKNCFSRALPTVSVPGYLGTDPVSLYITRAESK